MLLVPLYKAARKLDIEGKGLLRAKHTKTPILNLIKLTWKAFRGILIEHQHVPQTKLTVSNFADSFQRI